MLALLVCQTLCAISYNDDNTTIIITEKWVVIIFIHLHLVLHPGQGSRNTECQEGIDDISDNIYPAVLY